MSATDSTSFECVICLEPHVLAQRAPCGHKFCLPCHGRIMRETNTKCPLCREYLPLEIGKYDFIVFSSLESVSVDRVQEWFSYVCAYGQLEDIKRCVAHGVNVHYCDSVGETGLRRACQEGNLDIVQYLVDNGVSVNQITIHGGTPLYVATAQKHVDVVKFLLAHGADMNQGNPWGQTGLHISCQNGDLEIVKLFIENGMDVNTVTDESVTPLYFAAQEGHVDVVKYLLEKQADITIRESNEANALFVSCQRNQIDVVKILLQHGANINETFLLDDRTCLWEATQKNHLALTKYLIENQADINATCSYRQSPLVNACIQQNASMIQYLVEHDADVNQVNHSNSGPLSQLCYHAKTDPVDMVEFLIDHGAIFNETNDQKWTALHISSEKGHLNTVQYFVENTGIDINCLTYANQSPLYLSCVEGHVDVAQYLIDKDADVNQIGPQGNSCLHETCHDNHVNTVKLLLEHGIDCTIKNNNGGTALHVAAQSNNMTIVKLLVEYGLDINEKVVCAQSDFNEYTPLLFACTGGSIDMVKYILEVGNQDVNFEITGPDLPITPLMMASQFGHQPLFHYLITQGANINIEETDFLSWAIITENDQMVEYLLETIYHFEVDHQHHELLLQYGYLTVSEMNVSISYFNEDSASE